jgi:hypothetical protein
MNKKDEQRYYREMRDFFAIIDPLSETKGICGTHPDSPICGDHCDLCPLIDHDRRGESPCIKLTARERREIVLPYCKSKLISEKLELI